MKSSKTHGLKRCALIGSSLPFFVAFIIVSWLSTAFAITDTEYEILKENSPEFAEADKQLGLVWKTVKSSLNEESQKTLLSTQRDWIKSGWDIDAKKLMDEGLSRTKAYTKACENRAEYLQRLVDGNVSRQVAANPESNMPKGANSSTASDQKTVVVEAEGSGATKMEALKDAWTEAVRKAVGMYTASKTETLNDELTEKIAAYSRGQVNSFKTLFETQENGVWKVKIKANVDRDVMQETVAGSKSKTLTLEGDMNVVAKRQSVEDKKKDAKEFKEAILEQATSLLDFSKCLDYEPSLFKIKDKQGNEFIYMKHVLKIDLAKFKTQSNQLEKLVSQIAISTKRIELNQNNAKKALKIIEQNKYPIEIDPNYHVDKLDKDIVISYPNRTLSGGITFKFPGYEQGAAFGDITLMGPDWNIHENSWLCFFKNTSSSSCYLIGNTDQLRKLLPPTYTLEFTTEKGKGGYDDVLASTSINTLKFEGRLVLPSSPTLGYWLAPDLQVGFDKRGWPSYPVLVLICLQYLDIPNEERGDAMDLVGKYTIEAYK